MIIKQEPLCVPESSAQVKTHLDLGGDRVGEGPKKARDRGQIREARMTPVFIGLQEDAGRLMLHE